MLSRMTSAPAPSVACLHHLDEVLLAVVDRDLGTELAHQVPLLRRARGGEDPGAVRRRQLDRERADAARAAVDQQRLLRAQAGDHEHVGPDRARDLRQRGRRHQVDAVGHRHQLAGGQRHLGGVGPGRQQGAAGVAHLPVGDAVPDGGDGPAALHAEDVGGPGRRRVEALPLQQVGPVEAGRGDVEHDLARPRLRVGPLPDREDLGSTGSVSHHSAHGCEPRTVPRQTS